MVLFLTLSTKYTSRLQPVMFRMAKPSMVKEFPGGLRDML
jgi:hypothetical protein